MGEVDKALNYIFWLSLILILVAYYAGASNVFQTMGQQLVAIIQTSTGRNAQGQFANYPK